MAVVHVGAIVDLQGVGAGRQRGRGGPGVTLASLARDDLAHGLEVVRRAILQGQGHCASSFGPGDVEGLASLDVVEVAVGDENSADPSRESGEDSGENSVLHFCWWLICS